MRILNPVSSDRTRTQRYRPDGTLLHRRRLGDELTELLGVRVGGDIEVELCRACHARYQCRGMGGMGGLEKSRGGHLRHVLEQRAHTY
jgi:hypothetical protein